MLENRYFKIWDYSVSHRVIILRSEMQMDDVDYDLNYIENCTIDLEFSDVFYLELFSDFTLISIKAKFLDDGLKQFILTHEQGVLYITAGNCILGKSNWVTESRLTNFELSYDLKVVI
ncbi:MAG: hypothetical protein ACI86M_002894 [Saprospiraceae bacterium]|jgi:hypothetical protein